MDEADIFSMQKHVLRFAAFAVFTVTEYGMAYKCKVHTQLMRPAGKRLKFQQAIISCAL